jgi:hypothetical protein
LFFTHHLPFFHRYEDLGNDPKSKNLGMALEQALKQAMNDETFRKVKRMSYSSNAASSVSFCSAYN